MIEHCEHGVAVDTFCPQCDSRPPKPRWIGKRAVAVLMALFCAIAIWHACLHIFGVKH